MRINIVQKVVQNCLHGKLYFCTIYILCIWRKFLHPLLIWNAWQSWHFFNHQSAMDAACHAGLMLSRKPISCVSLCSRVLPCPLWQGDPHMFLVGVGVTLTQRTIDVKIWTSARSITQESRIWKDKLFIIEEWGKKKLWFIKRYLATMVFFFWNFCTLRLSEILVIILLWKMYRDAVLSYKNLNHYIVLLVVFYFISLFSYSFAITFCQIH